MSEALWAQVISGAFGLATMVLSTYLPTHVRRRSEQPRPAGEGKDDDDHRGGDGSGANELGDSRGRDGDSRQADTHKASG
jgi:hypothetical protein